YSRCERSGSSPCCRRSLAERSCFSGSSPAALTASLHLPNSSSTTSAGGVAGTPRSSTVALFQSRLRGATPRVSCQRRIAPTTRLRVYVSVAIGFREAQRLGLRDQERDKLGHESGS